MKLSNFKFDFDTITSRFSKEKLRVYLHTLAYGSSWFFTHIMTAFVVVCIAAVYVYFFLYVPPSAFPTHAIVSIPKGQTLDDATILLEAQGVVQSSSALKLYIALAGHSHAVQAGDYFFDRPLTLLEVAERITAGDYGLRPIKVTIPEGATSYEIAKIFTNKLGRFDEITFLMLAENKEGYLFPDTYYFLPNATAAQVIDTMERNFYTRVEPLEEDIARFGKPLDEVLTMASLLEKEARTTVSRRTIAGILWNRLDVGMPLQVDAVFGYINKRPIYNPKFSDLKIESPYNTYKNKGLPPGPIANPGFSSIKAAVTPIPSKYFFYLTGNDGRMYYSKVYSEHLRYKRLYLN